MEMEVVGDTLRVLLALTVVEGVMEGVLVPVEVEVALGVEVGVEPGVPLEDNELLAVLEGLTP